MTPRINPRVFERAIPLLARTDQEFWHTAKTFCCHALRNAGARSQEEDLFNELFKPRYSEICSVWWGNIKLGYTARVIALQLAAEVARDENRKPL